MTVIELGDVTGRPPEPGDDRIGPRLGRPRIRRIAAGLATLTVLACAGSAPAAEPGVRLLWSVELPTESNVLVRDDTVFVVRGGVHSTVVAYRLADGTRLWSRNLPGSLAGFRTTPGGGPLLLSVEPPAEPAGEEAAAGRTTIALRAGTGEQVWRRPGEVHAAAIDDEGALLIRYDGRGGIRGMARIRLTDGEPYWERPVTGVHEIAVDHTGGRPGRIVTNDHTGHLTVLRYSDATVLAERRVPGLVTEPAIGRYVTLEAASGRLLVLHTDGVRSSSAAYDLATLREIPQISAAADVPHGCGVVICGQAAGGLAGLDPATGRLLWRMPEVAGISLILPDRMLVDVPDGGDHVLVESRSGRLLAAGLHGSVAPDHTRRDSVLLLNPTARPPGGTSVVRLDMRTGRRVLLGSLPAVPDRQRCQSTAGHLVCEGPGRLVVGAVPR